jgi:type II secretory pathway component PulM
VVALTPNQLYRQPVKLFSHLLTYQSLTYVCMWMPLVSAAVLSQLKQFLPRMQQANAELQQKLQVRRQIAAVAAAVAAVAPSTASSSDIDIK